MTKRSSIALALVFASTPLVAQERPRLPQGPAGTVTLSVADYDRLVDRAAQPDKRPEPPPVPAVVSRGDLRARVTGDLARGTLRLDGEVFYRGQVKVPLVSGATLLEARADGVPLPLVQEGDVHVAVLTGPAAFSLTLEWAAPVSAVPGRGSLPLPSPAAGSVTATIDLPGDPAEVRIEPGIVTRRQTAGGRTTVEATLEPGRRSAVSWSVRETATQASQAESRLLADVKSLITIGEGDLRMATLVDVTVVRGEPRTFEIRLPAGYEVAAVTGSSIDTTETRTGSIALTVHDPAQRRHQFLISLEQPHSPGSFKLDTSFPTVPAAQREVGETAIEGTGTIEVSASGDDGLRRMDVRETNPSLRSLARQPLLAAFRYQRRANETRTLTLDVKRFADAPVIAAAAERAVATTLVTAEGRTLTEVSLTLRNRAQPFMKVVLPAGATMLSVEVAGETAKPVLGSDGTRVPLLRTGFKPNGPYNVSFVYLHAGQSFAKRGDAHMALPQMDVPVTVLEWELFLPERYSAKPLAGNVMPAHLVSYAPTVTVVRSISSGQAGSAVGRGSTTRDQVMQRQDLLELAAPGQIVGRVVDPAGAALPGATITAAAANGVRLTAVTDAEGRYTIDNVPSGTVTVTSELSGFSRGQRFLTFDQQPRQVDFQVGASGVSETVTVQAEAPLVNTQAATSSVRSSNEPPPPAPPSQNVLNLQRRVAGVLPVRVDVPRAGTAYQFVKPLVLDEEARVSFRYKTR